MLRRISEPLALSEASLLALRPALNAPVLNVDYLPVGPARAAIVIFAEEYGGVGMAFGIRSTEGGQVAVFRNREPIDESAPLQDILEPALASAERMGFLFDEDMVEGTPGGQGRSEATALWGRLMGDVAMPPPPKAAPALPAATEPILDLTETMVAADAEVPELVLEQVALAERLELDAESMAVPALEVDSDFHSAPLLDEFSEQEAVETAPELECSTTAATQFVALELQKSQSRTRVDDRNVAAELIHPTAQISREGGGGTILRIAHRTRPPRGFGEMAIDAFLRREFVPIGYRPEHPLKEFAEIGIDPHLAKVFRKSGDELRRVSVRVDHRMVQTTSNLVGAACIAHATTPSLLSASTSAGSSPSHSSRTLCVCSPRRGHRPGVSARSGSLGPRSLSPDAK